MKRTDHPLPNRQIHLDFHTGPHIPDVGVEFDAEAFKRTLVEARVNSVTLFAKCHHGHLYYDTTRPERHPGLRPDIHLLEAQIEACRSVGIHTPIYLSVMCDEWAANIHPDWVCRNPDGTPTGPHPFKAGWQILDMSSPYSDFLEEQIVEVVTKFKPVDGIFLDMCWDQPSVSKWAVARMRQAGLNPESEADRAGHASRVVRSYMARYNAVIKACNGSLPRIWYNSRPKTALVEEKQYLQHIEIEALPTGGWGYTYFPLNVRWARNMGLPFIGMTARFHKSWSDFGGYKPEAALKYEVSQMVAQGGGCSIGDQLHPRGVLDAEAYRRIGKAYRHIEAIELFTRNTTPVTEVAMLRDPRGPYTVRPGDTLEGAVRLLQRLLIQFDFIPPAGNWNTYPVTIVPEGIEIDASLESALRTYLQNDGKVVLAGRAPLRSASSLLRSSLGVLEMADAGPGVPFLRYDPAIVADAEVSEVAQYDGSLRLRPVASANCPATLVEAYFPRAWDRFCGHAQSPPDRLTDDVPVTITDAGAAIGFDLFGAFATHGQEHLVRLARTVFEKVHPRRLVLGTLASHVEVSLLERGKERILHVLSYAPQRRTPTLDLVEEATPLVDARVSLRFDREPKLLTLEPGSRPVTYEYRDGYVSICWSSTEGHDLICIR